MAPIDHHTEIELRPVHYHLKHAKQENGWPSHTALAGLARCLQLPIAADITLARIYAQIPSSQSYFLSFFSSHSLLSHTANIRNIKARSTKPRSLSQFLPSRFEDGSFDSKEKGCRRRRSNPAEEAGQQGQGC
jgi:hypothetical protein